MSDQIRDCIHGNQKGKCDTCDVILAEQTIATLEQRIAELEAWKEADNRHIYGQRARIDELEAAHTCIAEYWNFDNNEAAMTDALYAMINIAQEALAPTAQGEQL